MTQDNPASLPRQITFHKFPLDRALLSVAAEMIAQARQNEIELDTATVILPNLRATAHLASALRRAADRKLLILPRMTTLREFARSIPIPYEIIPDSLRDALLYNALKHKKWFEKPALWEVCQGLRRLFDELTSQRILLPHDYYAFEAQIEEAHALYKNKSLQFEARLCHELWYALQAEQHGKIDVVAAYHLRLEQIAQSAKSPLYAIALAQLSLAERAFLDKYAQRAPVDIFEVDEVDLGENTVSSFLYNIWTEPPSNDAKPDTFTSLRQRSLEYAARFVSSPIEKRIKFYGAQSIEEEAHAADTKIREWLIAGHKQIAVVVFDRLVARRTRALLERAKILVEDETGWTLSTTSASTVVARWLDLIANDFYHQDFLDFCKSPFSFSNWETNQRKSAVYKLERWIRRESVIFGLRHYRQLISNKENVDDVNQILSLFESAAKEFGKNRIRLSAWLECLERSLTILGVMPALERDSAGQELVQLLTNLHSELADDGNIYTFAEWRDWLNRQFESTNYRDSAITSPVVFTYLGATRLRQFDSVLLLGADVSRLPDTQSDSLLFNQSVREQLGLTTAKSILQQIQSDLFALLVTTPQVYVSWQSVRDDEVNLLSPYFERLQAAHKLAFKTDLIDNTYKEIRNEVKLKAMNCDVIPGPTHCPAVVVDPGVIPTTISASAYNSLMTCPYQFYARYMLKINELDDVRITLEKVDYGRLAHEILNRFHRSVARTLDSESRLLEQTLRSISDDVFSRTNPKNYFNLAWEMRWKKIIPAYIAWQQAQERAGWHWKDGEVKKKIELRLSNNKTLLLEGRLDRVDQSDQNQKFAVVDYKMQSLEQLKKKLKLRGEDIQLPVYAQVLGASVTKAAYLSLDKDKVSDDAKLDGDIQQLGIAVLQRLEVIFDMMYEGTSVRAQGISDDCQYCEMRGLCRKDYWV